MNLKFLTCTALIGLSMALTTPAIRDLAEENKLCPDRACNVYSDTGCYSYCRNHCWRDSGSVCFFLFLRFTAYMALSLRKVSSNTLRAAVCQRPWRSCGSLRVRLPYLASVCYRMLRDQSVRLTNKFRFSDPSLPHCFLLYTWPLELVPGVPPLRAEKGP